MNRFTRKLNLKKWAIALAVLAVVVFAYQKLQANNKTGATEKSQATQATARTALTVNKVKLALNKMDVQIMANGNIAAWQEALIGAEVNGLQLDAVLVNVGDMVKRGQVIARFKTNTIATEIAQAKANLAEAKVAAIEAASNAARARQIQNTGALSTQQIEQYLNAEASANARVDSLTALLNANQVKLAQTTVLAPDNGIISSRTATVGAVVSPGQELFKLIRQGRLEWRAELTSADVGRIKTGMATDITLPDNTSIKGKVRAISPMIDSQTRDAIVYVDLPASTAKAGMYAHGNFNVGEHSAFTLPNSAIVMREGFSYVMQILPDQHIKQVKVNLGGSEGKQVQVIGLDDENADFVASGGAFLVDGDRVKVVETPTSDLNQNNALKTK